MPKSTVSPALTSSGMTVPSSCTFPVANGDDLALLGFFLGGVGNDDPTNFFFRFLDALDDQPVVEWGEP